MVFVGSKILRVKVVETGEILQGEFRMKIIAIERRSGEDRRAGKGQRTGKGRRAGEDHPNAILTDGEVELVRQCREEHRMTYDQIAAKFEISKSSVAKICQYNRR